MRCTVLLICFLALACGDGKKPPETKAPTSAAPKSAAPASTAKAPASEASEAPASKAPATAPRAVTVAPIDIAAKLDEKQQDGRIALATKILDGKLKGLALRNRRNAPILLDLAAKHPHPKVVVGALDAIARTFTSQAGKPNSVNEDYRKVVRVRMRATDPSIRLAAIGATRLLLAGTPEMPFVDLLIAETKSDDPAVRAHACRMLTQLNVVQSADQKNEPSYPKVMAALAAAAKDAPPAALITIMERLARPMSSDTPNRADFTALAAQHRSSDDPGVRGAANLLFATTATDKGAAAKALTADLKHANGYVRGATLEALGLLGHPPAIHAIVGLLDDDAKATHLVPAKPQAFPLALDYGRTVNAVALGALRELSKKRFDYKRSDLKREPAAVITAAKAWYKKAGKQIPSL